MTTQYKYTETGRRYILGYNSFKTDYINSLAHKYGYRSNRVYGDQLNLPHDYESIKFKPNEIINYEAVNKKIELIYKNYIYILTKCSIGKTDGLQEFRGTSYINISSYDNTTTGAYKAAYTTQPQDSILDNDVRSVELTDNIMPGSYSLIVATKNRLLLTKFTPVSGEKQSHYITMISTPESEHLVDSENDLEFKSIKKIVSNHKGALFTLDTGRNIIYRHNIKGLTRGDRILNSKQTTGRMLDVMVGVPGDINSKIQFVNPVDIHYYDNRLYVLDGEASNYRVKVYDDQINWLETYNISLDFVTNTPVSIACNQGHLYILTTQGQLMSYNISQLQQGILIPVMNENVNIIDTDYNKVEKYIEIKFSKTNDNICYIITNRSVYKKMVDNITTVVGYVDWKKHQITTTVVHPIGLAMIEQYNHVGNEVVLLADTILTGHSRAKETLLYHFKDSDNLMYMLNEQYEENIIKLEDCYIKPGEYVSSFVYNKIITKMLYNINLVYDNISYVASAELTETGSLKYPGVRYVSELEVSKYRVGTSIDETNYIGVNELVSTGTLNRFVLDITTRQTNILDLIRTRTNSPEFYHGSYNILKRNPVPAVESYLSTDFLYRTIKIE